MDSSIVTYIERGSVGYSIKILYSGDQEQRPTLSNWSKFCQMIAYYSKLL